MYLTIQLAEHATASANSHFSAAVCTCVFLWHLQHKHFAETHLMLSGSLAAPQISAKFSRAALKTYNSSMVQTSSRPVTKASF